MVETETRLIIAGHGGQGVILMGRLLAHAGMSEGLEVTFFPSYGPAMRGGTANCSVVISPNQIASPVVNKPNILVAMNEPSLLKFGPKVPKGGYLFINSSLVSTDQKWNGLNVLKVQATATADRIGNTKVANIIMLGALAQATQVVRFQTLQESLEAVLPKRRHKLLNLNRKALKEGSLMFLK